MFRRAFDPTKKKKVTVLGVPMAYVEYGTGDPIVLLHGNPTSSYLWRKVIPELAGSGRCIAVDLIGMGASAQVFRGPETYKLVDHQEYLEAFLDVMGIEENVTLVAHDWGGPLAFDWGRRHAGAVKGVAYMETLVTNMTWEDWPESSRSLFQAMRTDAGERIVLEKNVFVDRILPASVLEPMSEEVLDVYRFPYLEPGESRRPILTWARQIPIDGEPADVSAIVSANEAWLADESVRKLFVNAEPGFLLTGRPRAICRAWPSQQEVTVRGSHFVPEDSGGWVGSVIAEWLSSL